MTRSDPIKLVIIHLHELNYPILKGDMGITQWKVELSRTERHTKRKSTMSKNPSTKIAGAPVGCPTDTPGQSVV